MLAKLKPFISSTRFKTSIWYAAIFLILEILLGLLVYISLYNSLLARLDTALKNQGQAISRIMTEKHVDIEHFQPDSAYQSTDDFIWDVIYDEVAFNQRNNYIQIFFNDKLLFKTSNLANDTLSFPLKSGPMNLFDFKDPNLTERTIRAVQLNNKSYKIIVAYPLDNISQTLHSLVEIYLLLAPLLFIVALIGGIMISTKALSRIDAIIRKTEEITAHNLDEKIEGEEYRDEYGRLVKKMNEMIKRIKTSVDYMNHFSLSAAHELKTPLTIIRGETEIALKSPKSNGEYIDVLRSNYEEVIRLTKIIDNMFLISKIDNSLIKINKERVLFGDFLKALVHSLKILGIEKNIKTEFVSDINPVVEIDTVLMTQALTNLIDNAVKYGDENQVITINLKKVAGGRIAVEIINKGEAIPKEFLDKIFDRFYRIESSRNRKTGGAGLGLSVVKSIMNWHNVEIKVESGLSGTTKVSILIDSLLI